MKKIIVSVLISLFPMLVFAAEPPVIDKLQSSKMLGYMALTVTSKGSLGTTSNPITTNISSGTNLQITAIPTVQIRTSNTSLSTVNMLTSLSSIGYAYARSISFTSSILPNYIGLTVAFNKSVLIDFNCMYSTDQIQIELFKGTYDSRGATITSYVINSGNFNNDTLSAYYNPVTLTTVSTLYPVYFSNLSPLNNTLKLLGGNYFIKFTGKTGGITSLFFLQNIITPANYSY